MLTGHARSHVRYPMGDAYMSRRDARRNSQRVGTTVKDLFFDGTLRIGGVKGFNASVRAHVSQPTAFDTRLTLDFYHRGGWRLFDPAGSQPWLSQLLQTPSFSGRMYVDRKKIAVSANVSWPVPIDLLPNGFIRLVRKEKAKAQISLAAAWDSADCCTDLYVSQRTGNSVSGIPSSTWDVAPECLGPFRQSDTLTVPSGRPVYESVQPPSPPYMPPPPPPCIDNAVNSPFLVLAVWSTDTQGGIPMTCARYGAVIESRAGRDGSRTGAVLTQYVVDEIHRRCFTEGHLEYNQYLQTECPKLCGMCNFPPTAPPPPPQPARYKAVIYHYHQLEYGRDMPSYSVDSLNRWTLDRFQEGWRCQVFREDQTPVLNGGDINQDWTYVGLTRPKRRPWPDALAHSCSLARSHGPRFARVWRRYNPNQDATPIDDPNNVLGIRTWDWNTWRNTESDTQRDCPATPEQPGDFITFQRQLRTTSNGNIDGYGNWMASHDVTCVPRGASVVHTDDFVFESTTPAKTNLTLKVNTNIEIGVRDRQPRQRRWADAFAPTASAAVAAASAVSSTETLPRYRSHALRVARAARVARSCRRIPECWASRAQWCAAVSRGSPLAPARLDGTRWRRRCQT